MINSTTMRYLVLLCYCCILCSCQSKISCKSRHGQSNAVWSESLYLRGYQPSTHEMLTDERIKQYCTTITENQIKNIYLFAGPFDSTGHLPDYPFSAIAAHSVQLIRQYAPGVRILPWVGGIEHKTVYLDDSAWVNNALADTKRLVETLHTDGVHIDFEFIPRTDSFLAAALKPEKPGDMEAYGNHVNVFHQRLRALIPNSFISSVLVASVTDNRPWKRKNTMAETSVLLQYIDQLSFLYYDTGIKDNHVFQQNCNELVDQIQQFKTQHPAVEFLIAFGTFVNEPALQHYRDLSIESIPHTITTIDSSLSSHPSPEKLVSGLSIFCDWETDETEWQAFYKYWVDSSIH